MHGMTPGVNLLRAWLLLALTRTLQLTTMRDRFGVVMTGTRGLKT